MDLNPGGTPSLEEGMEETLTVRELRVPDHLRRIPCCTDVIESAFSVVETVCRNVKRWRDGDHIERWVTIALDRGGKLSDAAREFGEAVQLNPGDGDFRFGLGIALARLGRTDESIVQLSEAARIKPGATEPRQALQDLLNLKQRSNNK